jgi:hypothetical protein
MRAEAHSLNGRAANGRELRRWLVGLGEKHARIDARDVWRVVVQSSRGYAMPVPCDAWNAATSAAL